MKNTVLTFQQAKKEGTRLSMLTAYDYSTAKLVDAAGINSILVGDSLGNTILGYEDTLSVTMEDMIHHTAAVARGAKNALVIGDMPFMSYQASVYDAVVNAGRLMKEGRANAVKLEGGASVCEQIKAIVGASIPVCAHIGLTPQSINAFGGFKVQGKGESRHSSCWTTPAAYRRQVPLLLSWKAFRHCWHRRLPTHWTFRPLASAQAPAATVRFWFIRICSVCLPILSRSSSSTLPTSVRL